MFSENKELLQTTLLSDLEQSPLYNILLFKFCFLIYEVEREKGKERKRQTD